MVDVSPRTNIRSAELVQLAVTSVESHFIFLILKKEKICRCRLGFVQLEIIHVTLSVYAHVLTGEAKQSYLIWSL